MISLPEVLHTYITVELKQYTSDASGSEEKAGFVRLEDSDDTFE